jgi:signal transduction histidine kinase
MPADPSRQSSRQAPGQSPIRVLLVDDDEDEVVLARSRLADVPGIQVELDWTSDYDDGLRAVLTGDYQVCLVDYRLGARNGVDFVRDVRDAGGATPLIVLTGQASYEVDFEAMEAGAADFIDKFQLNADLLGRSIRYAIRQRAAEEDRLRLLQEQAARAQAEAATRVAREQAERLEAEVLERRRAEAELSRAKQEAEAANRAKDRFLATLSHELRTPLAPVLAVVSRLEVDPRLDAELQAELSRVRRNVELEARLIDDLLDLTRITQGKLELERRPVDLRPLLLQALEICCAEASAAGRLELDTDLAPLPPVAADAPRLTQVFWNLLNNAVKFTPAGGRVRVSARAEAGAVVVDIEDTGIGIEPEVVPRLFRAFEQGDPEITRQFGGVGLGLAISHAIAELHGGTLTVASAGRGRGATFTLRLPAQAAAPLATDPDRASDGLPQGTEPVDLRTEVAAGRGLDILLVEDHADTAEALADLLAAVGHRVTVANTAAAALERAAEHQEAAGEGFDLVVSDLGLPDQSGLELMRELVGRHGLTGIALSGYGMEEDVRCSRAAGFSRHLTKPVPMAALLEAIREVTQG